MALFLQRVDSPKPKYRLDVWYHIVITSENQSALKKFSASERDAYAKSKFE
jgi:hypothetical protein